MKRLMVITLDAPATHCGSEGSTCKHYIGGPGRSCGLFGGLLDQRVEGGNPYPRRSTQCHDAEYRLNYEIARARAQSEEEERQELAAAISHAEALKRERDDARKALGEEQAEREAFNRENLRLGVRVRELETELQERGAGYGRT